MSFVDIAIIVVIVLMGLLGIFKGFFKMVVGFFGWFITLIIAFFLTGTIAYAVLDINFIAGFTFFNENSIYSWVSEWGWITSGPLADRLLNGINEAVVYADNVESMAAAIFSYYILCAIVFVVLFILLRLVMMLLTFFVKKLRKSDEGPNPLSRILGMLVGFVRGFLYAGLLMLVLSYAIHFNFMEPVLNDIEKGFLAVRLLDWTGSVSDWMMTSNTHDVSTRINAMFVLHNAGNNNDNGENVLNGTGQLFMFCSEYISNFRLK